MTNTTISFVDWEWRQPEISIHWRACCAHFMLSFAAVCAFAQTAKDHPDRQTFHADMVPQAHVAREVVVLPLVDGNGLNFKRFSTEDGLSQTMVTQILQDNQGFIWFATLYGLDRYDGYSFKVFKHEAGDPSSLGGVHNYCLFKDRTGMLWVGGEEFLDRFDPVTETAKHFRIGNAKGENLPVRQISQDHTGALWLSTNGGLFRLDPETGQIFRFQHEQSNPFSLRSDVIRWTLEDREGVFWVASTEGVDAFDWKTGKVTLHIPLREYGEMSIQEDQFGVLWIVHVTGGGLAAFDRRTNTLTQYSVHASHLSDGLTGMLSILEDRDGTLWFGTMGEGILKFDRKGPQLVPYNIDSLLRCWR